MNLFSPVRPCRSPSIWMIGRVDQSSILAAHLADKGQLARWDSFWRHDGRGAIAPSARKVAPVLSSVPGRHLLPDILGKAATKLRLPAPNLYSDIPLSLLAAFNMPGADILHGQGNYSLPAMRRARRHGMIIISDVTGQLAPVRHRQLAAEYAAYGQTYREISDFLAHRRLAEAQFADAVFAPSDAVAEGLQDCGIAPEKIFLVPFTSRSCHDLLARTRFLPPTDDTTAVRLLFVGNLSLAKGLATLLAAWPRLRDRFGPQISLTLVGPEKPCFRHLRTDLPPGCIWLGPRPQQEVCELMLASDIFVFPSLSEGRSLAAMEAMAAGCAVVTTPDAASPAINRVSGMIVPPRDPAALFATLSELVSDPALRRAIGQAARAQMREEVKTGYGHRVEAAYETVLSRHG